MRDGWDKDSESRPVTVGNFLLGPHCHRCGARRIAGVCSVLGCFESPYVYAALAQQERARMLVNHDPGDEDRSAR